MTLKFSARHATNRDKVCFCRQVSTRQLANCHEFLSLLSLDVTVQQPSNLTTPQKNFPFSVSFRQYSRRMLFESCSWLEKQRIDRSTSVQVKSLSEPPSQPSSLTSSWPSCIVTGHDQMTVKNNGHCSHVYRHGALPWSNRDPSIYGLPRTGMEVLHVGWRLQRSSVRSIALSWVVDRDLRRSRSTAAPGSFTVTSTKWSSSERTQDVAKLCSRSADPRQVHAERFSFPRSF